MFFSLLNLSHNSASFGLGALSKAFFIPEQVIFEVSICSKRLPIV